MSWTHLRDATVKGRKQHMCRVCGDTIEIGELHIARTGIDSYDGFVTARFHPECEAYARTWDEMDWETTSPGDVSRQYASSAAAALRKTESLK